jgi:hypothetical protein
VQERQLLLEISQSSVVLEKTGANARRMTATLPMVNVDGSRVVWCERCPRGSRSKGRSRRRLSLTEADMARALHSSTPATGAGAFLSPTASPRGRSSTRTADKRDAENAEGTRAGRTCGERCVRRVLFR